MMALLGFAPGTSKARIPTTTPSAVQVRIDMCRLWPRRAGKCKCSARTPIARLGRGAAPSCGGHGVVTYRPEMTTAEGTYQEAERLEYARKDSLTERDYH